MYSCARDADRHYALHALCERGDAGDRGNRGEENLHAADNWTTAMMRTRPQSSQHLDEFRWRRSGSGDGLPSSSNVACERVISIGRKQACSVISLTDAQLQRFLTVGFLPTQPLAGLQFP